MYLLSSPLLSFYLLVWLLLILSFIALWSDRIHGIVLVILNWLRFVGGSGMWCVLEKLGEAAETGVYSIPVVRTVA